MTSNIRDSASERGLTPLDLYDKSLMRAFLEGRIVVYHKGPRCAHLLKIDPILARKTSASPPPPPHNTPVSSDEEGSTCSLFERQIQTLHPREKALAFTLNPLYHKTFTATEILDSRKSPIQMGDNYSTITQHDSDSPPPSVSDWGEEYFSSSDEGSS
jgi:hypothetical protein